MRVPTKQNGFTTQNIKTTKDLKQDMLQWLHNGYLVIANVKVHIPKENAYILASARVKTDKKTLAEKKVSLDMELLNKFFVALN